MNLNLGPFAALIGAVVLAIGFALLFKSPRTVSLEVIAWTVTIGLLAVCRRTWRLIRASCSWRFPPCSFSRTTAHRRYTWLLSATSMLLVLTSALTYGGRSLTP